MKIAFFIIFLYLLSLLQTSLLLPLNVLKITPNFVLLAAFFENLLEPPHKKTGFVIGFIAGFLMDVFSLSNFRFFGFHIFVLLFFTFLLKYLLSNYVRFSAVEKFQNRY